MRNNENTVKRFLDKLQSFVHHKFDIAVKWFTKKIRSLFRLKDKKSACKIYEGICSCSANYIGETKRNVETRWNKHENLNKDAEPAKHLRKFPYHKFYWKTLLKAPTNAKLRKILESSMTALKQPSLNEQLDFDQFILFRNGVTQIFYILITEFKLTNTYLPFANLPIYLLLQTFIAFTSDDLIAVYTL